MIFTYIDTEEKLRDAVGKLSAMPVLAVDTETTGLDPFLSQVILLQVGNKEQQFVIDTRKVSIEPLRHILEGDKPKVLHNAKFDYKMLAVQKDIRMENVVCTMIVEQVLEAGRPDTKRSGFFGLAGCYERYTGKKLSKAYQESFIDHKGDFSKQQLEYAAKDIVAVFELAERQGVRIILDDLEHTAKLECLAVPAFGDIEINGFKLDKDAWVKLAIAAKEESEKVREELDELFEDYVGTTFPLHMRELGSPINYDSDEQVKSALIGIGLDIKSTGKDILGQLKHPACDKVIEYRKQKKIVGTYGENFLEHIHSKTGRVHPDFRQCGTDTGRASCSSPNLQNIIKESDFRSCFVPESGYKMITADYSGAELRIIAEMSQDPRFLKAFREGEDLHSTVGSLLFKKPVSKKENPQLRDAAKCFHPDVEVLTKTGWKKIIDLSKDEQVIQAIPGLGGRIDLEWVTPIEHYEFKHPSGKLVHLYNEGIDIKVTPDHRMLYLDRNLVPKVTTPDGLNTKRYWANSGFLNNNDEGINIDDRILRLAVAVQADGSINRGSSGVRFGFSKLRKINRLRELLKDGEYTEHPCSQKGVASFYIKSKLGTEILFLLDNKSFPYWWLELSPTSRMVVLEEARFWDSHKADNWTMYSYANTDQQSVDVLQALASLSGMKTRKITKPIRHEGHSTQYQLSVKDHHLSRCNNINISIEDFTDNVVCLSVPSTFILVRQNGIPVITGQSINFGLAYGMGPDKLARMMKISNGEASKLLDEYFRQFPQIKVFLDRVRRFAVKAGYSKTIGGRRRYYDTSGTDGNGSRTAEIERQGGNMPIQGTNSDMTKMSLYRLRQYFNDHGTPAKLVNTVHDEIVVEAREDAAEEIELIVQSVMKECGEYYVKSIPIESETHVGDCWGKG